MSTELGKKEMELSVYEEVQVTQENSAVYTMFNRGNHTPHKQQENGIVDKPTAKRCLFLWIGVLTGSVVSGVTIFLVVQYGVHMSYNVTSCFWTEWTSWTPCETSLIIGKQTRAQKHTGYFKKCEEKERYETKVCYDATEIFFDRTLDIRLDHTTLYSTCYLSLDNTTLSNRYTDRTPYNPRAGSRFQNYKGAMGNTCVENSTSIYYEIYFQYVITSNLSSTYLVLELGIGERNKIDNYYYVGNSKVSGWSFHLQNCETFNKVCLQAQHHPHEIVIIIESFSNNTAGTNVIGTFAMLIDRERNKFSLFYNDTVLFTFHDVLSNVSLCPVFGVYNPHLLEVDLQIVSVGNMTSMV